MYSQLLGMGSNELLIKSILYLQYRAVLLEKINEWWSTAVETVEEKPCWEKECWVLKRLSVFGADIGMTTVLNLSAEEEKIAVKEQI